MNEADKARRIQKISRSDTGEKKSRRGWTSRCESKLNRVRGRSGLCPVVVVLVWTLEYAGQNACKAGSGGVER